MRQACRLVVMVLCLCASLGLHAQTRAWLDRDHIAFGETVTLNIETDNIGRDAPDYSVLRQDFRVSGHSSRRQASSVNGRQRVRTLYAVALQPRHEGVIGIPAIRVGNQTTQPLTLTVTPAAQVPAQAGAVVFLQTEVDDRNPYVQQAVGVTLRLYYAVPLLSGQLEQPPPEGASLLEVGQDRTYTRQMAGRRYHVLERHYLLIPERSGAMTLPGAQFHGRGVAGFFDDLLGGNRGDRLDASAAPHALQVRPRPDNAGTPWLPLHDLQLDYLVTPQSVAVGEVARVVVELVADGATAQQLPELTLDAGNAAQVFPEQARVEEGFRNGRPQVTVRRTFSVVPAQAGQLRIEAPPMRWWDVASGSSREATLPPLVLEVGQGQGAASGAAPLSGSGLSVGTLPGGTSPGDTTPDQTGWIDLPGVQEDVRPWALATVVFALLWLLTLGWALQRRSRRDSAVQPSPGRAAAGVRSHAALRRALDIGDLGEVVEALSDLATPRASGLDDLMTRIDAPRQREALAAVQQARWGDGDVAVARRLLREAFKQGPRWRSAPAQASEPLPPLYPRSTK